MEKALSSEQHIWKRIFFALSALSLLLLPVLSIPHGQSGDEWSLIMYGHDIYDYFFHNSTRALDYDVLNWQQVAGLHYYGGLYDFTVTFLHKTFFGSVNELTFRHIINALLGALLFIYTGLIGRHFGGWRSGVLAFLFIALSPRILGESMNNPKDIPFAFANVFFIYYLLKYIAAFGTKAQWKYTLLMGLGFGLAIGFRIGGLLMIPYALVFLAAYYMWDPAFRAKLSAGFSKAATRIVMHLAVVFVLGYIIGIMFWPWALQEPLTRPLEALGEMTSRQVPIRMLYEGAFIMNTDVPKYYTFKWIFISSPVLILLAFIAAILMFVPLSKQYGKPAILLLVFITFFPVLYAIYKQSVLYDTWRHFFFIYPGIVLLAALICDYLLLRFSAQKKYQYITGAVIAAGMLLPALWIIRSYPNEYTYFNELEGGAKAAYGVYDFDYYQNSGKQAVTWIRENAPKNKGKIIVASNMSSIDNYFIGDTQQYTGIYVRYNDRDTKDWDYYITYSRFIPVAQLEQNTWPPANAVHVISVDGIPISAVLERKSKVDIAANQAMERQQADSAYVLFQQSIKADPGNEALYVKLATVQAMKGMIKESLATLDQALKIDNSSPAVYNLQVQIYRAIGDNARAQQAESMLQQLMQ